MATDLVERGFVRHERGWINWFLDLEGHAPWLRELEEYAEFVWGSSWLGDSDALAEWFGLREPSHPFIDFSTGPAMYSGTWKLPSVTEWVEEHAGPGQKVVWVEDEVEADAIAWAEDQPNVLLVVPDPAVGLTREQFVVIKAFLS